MKATGIVRRIDDLGRVVIPKEKRRTLKIREGDPLEIIVDRDGEVISRNTLPLESWATLPKNMQTLFTNLGHIACIADRDMIIAVAGLLKRSSSTRPSVPLWKRQWKSAGP